MVRKYAPLLLEAKTDLMIMSIGALVDAHFLQELIVLAQSRSVRIFIPSGVIGELDAIKSANIGKLTDVAIRNIKPPDAIRGAPYIVRKKFDLKSMTTPKSESYLTVESCPFHCINTIHHSQC